MALSHCRTKMKNNENEEEKNENEKEKNEDEETTKFIELGKELHKLISVDVKDLYKANSEMKKIDSLVNFKASDWVSDRPHNLLHMISNMCGVDINTAPETKMTIISKIIELMP